MTSSTRPLVSIIAFADTIHHHASDQSHSLKPTVSGRRSSPERYVSFVEQLDICPTQCPVLWDIKPVAASAVDRGFLAHLHRSLRTSRFGAPHCSITTMA